ncbi:MAG: pentapeptide repeat-containing protein [Boseongicola sp. SB0667_bin_21]|nr:pentapeptide repeat-containing protein [Boseongicola sp. SB0667_bin_21]
MHARCDMKPFLPGLALALIPTALAAWDESAVTQLRETGRCEECDLTKADLRWAAVYAAELGGAPNLVYGVLDGSDLSGANLYGANLEGTSLRNANLTGADLSWSVMFGTDLTGADLTGAKLTGIIFCDTIMPDGNKNDAQC